MTLEFHVEVVDSYFTKTDSKNNYMYRGSLQDFYWNKGVHEILDVVRPKFNVQEKKTRQYFSNILKWDTQSDVSHAVTEHAEHNKILINSAQKADNIIPT